MTAFPEHQSFLSTLTQFFDCWTYWIEAAKITVGKVPKQCPLRLLLQQSDPHTDHNTPSLENATSTTCKILAYWRTHTHTYTPLKKRGKTWWGHSQIDRIPDLGFGVGGCVRGAAFGTCGVPPRPLTGGATGYLSGGQYSSSRAASTHGPSGDPSSLPAADPNIWTRTSLNTKTVPKNHFRRLQLHALLKITGRTH